ncbi:MAG: hypothetical protein ACLTSX_13820 [Collinsella sp.]
MAPRFMGLQSYAIVSGSMEPSFPVGSLVYAEPIEPETLAVGDVAVFWRNDEVVIHRVEENLYEDHPGDHPATPTEASMRIRRIAMARGRPHREPDTEASVISSWRWRRCRESSS